MINHQIWQQCLNRFLWLFDRSFVSFFFWWLLINSVRFTTKIIWKQRSFLYLAVDDDNNDDDDTSTTYDDDDDDCRTLPYFTAFVVVNWTNMHLRVVFYSKSISKLNFIILWQMYVNFTIELVYVILFYISMWPMTWNLKCISLVTF